MSTKWAVIIAILFTVVIALGITGAVLLYLAAAANEAKYGDCNPQSWLCPM
jgi:hypothetical protein